MSPPVSVPSGGHWRSRAGAWLGIGASPAALLVGAGLAARHDGAPPVVALLAGAALMAAVLAGQGALGLAPPVGEGTTLGALAHRYLPRTARVLINAVLASAMVGWFGFNVGLGGAAVSALLSLPGWVGVVAFGGPITALSFGGMHRWNMVAVVATISAIVLGAVVTARLGAAVVPVTAAVSDMPLALSDIAVFIGYVAVFGVRAPDFTAGLRRPTDLVWCVVLFVVPMIGMTLAGVSLHLGTGSSRLVETLAAPGGLAAGNVLVAASVIGASFTTTYSGSLALRAISPLSARQAVAAIAVPGLVLAVARFDRLLLPWLGLLAATLPPLVVPMATERLCRRRGAPARLVPTWTWLPASVIALAFTLAGEAAAPVAGLAVAGTATVIWRRRRDGAASLARPAASTTDCR